MNFEYPVKSEAMAWHHYSQREVELVREVECVGEWEEVEAAVLWEEECVLVRDVDVLEGVLLLETEEDVIVEVFIDEVMEELIELIEEDIMEVEGVIDDAVE